MKFSKPLLSASCAILAALSAPVSAQADDINWSIGTDYVSEYVFRGVSLGADSVQPYVELSKGNFTAGAWFSTQVGSGSELSADEVDFYAGYSVPLDGSISLDLGATYYHYPQTGALFASDGGAAGTYEFSASVGFDAPFAPSLTAYYDVTLEALTLEGGLGYSAAMSDTTSADFGVTAGLVDGDGFSYEWAGASAAVSRSLTDDASIYVGANFVMNSDGGTLNLDKFANPMTGTAFLAGTDASMLWFGTGISTSF